MTDKDYSRISLREIRDIAVEISMDRELCRQYGIDYVHHDPQDVYHIATQLYSEGYRVRKEAE